MLGALSFALSETMPTDRFFALEFPKLSGFRSRWVARFADEVRRVA
jgi:hypothetical protein